MDLGVDHLSYLKWSFMNHDHDRVNNLNTFFIHNQTPIQILFQTRQPVFVQLLGAAFRVSQCSWLTVDQRVNVENCIRTLSEVAKARGIAIPSDLDIQVPAGMRE